MIKSVKIIFFTLTILLLGYVAAGQIFLPADILDLRNVCEAYDGQWYYRGEDGFSKEIAIPGKIQANVGTIWTVIPNDLDPDISFMMLRCQDIKAYVNDKLVYEYSTKSSSWFGTTSPENYIILPFSYRDAGKIFSVELVTNTGRLYQPYIGSELGLWANLLRMYASELVIAGIVMIFGVMTILISKIFGFIYKRHLEITYLGLGITLAAVWLFANSVFRQIVLPNLSTASMLPFLCVMLTPFPFAIYMNEIQEHRYEKIYTVAAYIMALIDCTCCALYILGIREIENTFIFVALGCFIVILSIFLTFIIDYRKGKIPDYKYIAFGLLGALISAIVQLVIYFNRTGIFSGAYLALGLLILLLGAAIHTVGNIFSIENDKRAAIIANESKGKFLANMSHEIRTPINAILGMDEMILRESKELPIREYALDIHNAGKSLLSLINDILDISKIDSGKLEIIPVDYDLSSMIHDTMNMISHRAKTKNLEVTLLMDENLPSRLRGDDLRIRQILINILNNAVKYTNEGSVTLSVNGDRKDNILILHIKITDTGIGIKEEDLPKLFAEFERIEEMRNSHIEGTGLGMSITSQLLKLMGSHLDLTSVYGKGSCFFFDLEQEIIDDTPIGNLSERIRQQEEEYNYNTAFTAPDADVLVVDDNAINRKVFRKLLKDTQLRIDEADSGEACLQKIVHKKYDLIFLDHMMPGMDGIETLHAFSSLEGNLNSDTPVVALTANAVTGAKEMYLSNGFTAFLSKPIIFVKLEETLKKLLPPEKIIEETGTDAEQFDHIIAKTAEQSEIAALLETLPEINLEYAYLHSNSPTDLYDIMVDFLKMLDFEADALKKYAADISDSASAEESLKQYRVKVHAMKASAAMIGAISLSGMARMLEIAAIKEATDTILKVTPAFLEEWNSYKEKLKPIADRETKLSADSPKIEFNREIFLEQLAILNDAMQEMDVDRADDIVSLLKGFEYPPEIAGSIDDLFAAVEALDADRVAELTALLT